LGEHSELTALKGAGISLTRTLVPMFFFSSNVFLRYTPDHSCFPV
jgi:lipopolysaccharide export LptBFGC system permease protein LptF